MAAGLFYRLKTSGASCELVREYAKDVVWEGRGHLFDQQIYIFAKQLKRLTDLEGKVDLVITDSPLLLSAVYGKSLPSSFHQLVLHEVQRMDNMNVILKRVKPYVPLGRNQTEREAEDLDMEVAGALYGYTQQVDLIVPGDEGGLERVLEAVKLRAN